MTKIKISEWLPTAAVYPLGAPVIHRVRACNKASQPSQTRTDGKLPVEPLTVGQNGADIIVCDVLNHLHMP